MRPPDSVPRWEKGLRRSAVGVLTAGPAALAIALMADLLWRTGLDAWKLALLAGFAVLITLVAFGCAQAVVGFVIRRTGGDPRRLDTRRTAAPLPARATAVVLPVFNEDAGRVFAGVRVIYESLRATGQLDGFDFFVLSDSTDPNRWIEEEAAWVGLTRDLGAAGRLFYRRRRLNTNKKAGNLADFCRRWGGNYRYLLVLDADSIMTGETIVRLVQTMERQPRAGIIQTVPRLVNGATPFARLQQFASRLYGPVFQAGLNFWHLDESNYWGHNAILRLAPFIEHCALPELPGREPFGGRILSHDFVEAALMVRAGWAVWLAPELDGSFEESPANLIDFAKRDRRWLQGNLQHSWLLAARGLHVASRLHFACGIFGYLASPLWLTFLLLSTLLVARQHATGLSVVARDSLIAGAGLELRGEAGLLFIATMALLFLPKLLALLDLVGRPGEVAGFGGWRRLLASTAAETVWSALAAPILMLFHSKFLLWLALGRSVAWVTQRRGGDGAPEWREAILTHSWQTAVGLGWAAAALALDPVFFAWLTPVLVGLVGSIPLSLATAHPPERPETGAPRWFTTPPELFPPPVLAALVSDLAREAGHAAPPRELAADRGLMQAALDPYVNAVHVSLLREKETAAPAADRDRFAALREHLIAEGPAALAPRDKLALLLDANSMIRLHRELWSRPGDQLAEWWRLAIRQYNLLAPAPSTALLR